MKTAITKRLALAMVLLGFLGAVGSLALAAPYSSVDFSSQMNFRLQQELNPSFPTGKFLTPLGVPFEIPETGNNAWGAGTEGTGHDGLWRLEMPVNQSGVRTIYTIANTWWGAAGAQRTTIIASFDGGKEAVWSLVDGEHLRDWNLYEAFATTINNTSANEVFRLSPPTPVRNDNPDVLDMQTLSVPESLQASVLTKLVVEDQRGGGHAVFIAGVTISSEGPTTAGSVEAVVRNAPGDGEQIPLPAIRQEWVARYDGGGGPGGSQDEVASLAVDAQGSIYVTGSSVDASGDGDAVTVKYDASGRELWVARYEEPGGHPERGKVVRVDGSRGVYVLAASDLPGSGLGTVLLKYAPGGQKLWARRYDGEGDSSDDPGALAVDGAGNAYVGGGSNPGGSFVAKYDAAGNRLWVARGDLSGVSLIDVDLDGNVCAGGVVVERKEIDGVWTDVPHGAIVKYQPNGQELWSVERRIGCYWEDDCGGFVGLAFDAHGGLYAAGSGPISEHGMRACEVIHYDSLGRELWVTGGDTDHPPRDHGVGLRFLLAPSGVYTAGAWKFKYWNYWVGRLVRYSLDGKEQTEFEGADPYCAQAVGLAADAADRVYVTTVTGETGVWDAGGQRIGAASYSGPAAGSFAATAMALDGLGNFYVAGTSEGSGTLSDYALVKYATPKEAQLVGELPSSAGGVEPYFVDGMVFPARDPSRVIFCTENYGADCGGGTPAAAWTMRLNAAGTQATSVRFVQILDRVEHIERALLESSDGVLFTGSGWCGPKPPYYSKDGGETWRPAIRGGLPDASATYSLVEFHDEVYAGTGYYPFVSSVYRWLGDGGSGELWESVFEEEYPRSQVGRMTVFRDRLFIGTNPWDPGSCEGTVPVRFSTDGRSFHPTSGIPPCQGVAGLCVVEEKELLAVGAAFATDWQLQVYRYRWEADDPGILGDETWELMGPSPRLPDQIPGCGPVPLAYGASIFMYGRASEDGRPGIYRSADIGRTWEWYADLGGRHATTLAVHEGALYVGTLADASGPPAVLRIALDEGAGGIIVDDGDPGTVHTGAWYVSEAPEPWGEKSLYSKQAGAQYRWKVSVPEPGSYGVSLWWTALPGRVPSVPVAIRNAFGTTKLRVNQRLDGGQWNSLGVFSFTTDASVTVTSLGGGSTCADAVRVVRVDGPPTPPPIEPIVIDDGTSGTSFTGSWAVSGAPKPWGTRSLYSKQIGAEYRFEAGLPEAGTWEVFLWWTSYPSRLSKVPVIVEHSSGISMSYVNQLVGGGQWSSLGVFIFGPDATVRVRSLGGGSTCADAVKLVRIPGPPPPPPPQPVVIDDGGPGTSSSGRWAVSGGLHPWGTRSLYSKQIGAAYRFQASLSIAGTYEVFVWWTSYPSRLAEVPVTIRHASGERTVLVDQLLDGGRWNSVGIFDFTTVGAVTIRSPGGGTVCADAVCFVPR